jgi:hypothetical protein
MVKGRDVSRLCRRRSGRERWSFALSSIARTRTTRCAKLHPRRWIHPRRRPWVAVCPATEGQAMNRIIWIVGLIVIVLFILGFFGLR